MGLSHKSFEIFCGTGGVGKTTLATSRAFNLAQHGLRVLLITIDPAKRLKDLLGLGDASIGEVTPVNMSGSKLDALLMSPEKTIQRMAKNFDTPDLASNRIVSILSRPYGGMNEILSLVEVQMQFESGKYDVIVLDTPPGAHFLDFLEGIDKIRSFFNQNFIEIFNYLGQKTASAGKKAFSFNIINKFISQGVRKLLGYLQNVTGAQFIDDFIQAIQIIYQSKDAFLKGLSLQDKLRAKESCNWFLVTSVEQGKPQEAIELKSHASHFIHQDHYLVLNKCLEQELREWRPTDQKLNTFKHSFEQREHTLKAGLRAAFPVVLEFPEITSISPQDHVMKLMEKWNDQFYPKNISKENKAELEMFMCQNWDKVNAWIDEAQSKLPQPLTSSVDVRESKTKFAPVDHNMYPAGFNNLCGKDLLSCSDRFREAFDSIKPGIKRVGILPESHTKNKYYLDHLHKLKSTVELAETEVTLFSPDDQLFAETGGNIVELESFSGHKLIIHKARVMDGIFMPMDPKQKFDFEIIVLNNDQSVPLEVDWKSVKTPVHPSPQVGWFRRQKIHHFKHYQKVANEFAAHFKINPDLIQAGFSAVENVDFNTKEGLDELANEVDKVLSTLGEGASVFVKASQGTYGMGISVVSSGEEIRSMNRKVRNKMDVGKNNLKFTSVLIQEGVETILKYDEAPAEVTIYLVNGRSSGGFMRTNPLKGTNANLNSQGMVYRKFCISDVKQDCDHTIKEAVYSVIARLSTLAASREMKDLMESK